MKWARVERRVCLVSLPDRTFAAPPPHHTSSPLPNKRATYTKPNAPRTDVPSLACLASAMTPGKGNPCRILWDAGNTVTLCHTLLFVWLFRNANHVRFILFVFVCLPPCPYQQNLGVFFFFFFAFTQVLNIWISTLAPQGLVVTWRLYWVWAVSWVF